jgi:hypothetical protein
MLKSATLLLALALCSACNKKEPLPADTSASTPSAAAVTPPPPSASVASDTAPAAASADPEHVPITEDYEEQAQKEVTSANVSSKLDELEKEIKK